MSSLQRIVKLIAHISSSSEGITGAELAKVCGVPWAMVKGDIEAIQFKYPVFSEHDERDCEEDCFQPEVKWFPIQPFDGYLPITLGIQEIFALLRALDFLGDSPEKARIRQKLMDKFGFQAELHYCYIKGNMDPIKPIDAEVFPLLESAVTQQIQVSFKYGQRKSVVDQLGIVYYSKLRQWYLAARENGVNKTFNLQNLSSIKLTSNSFTPPEGFELKEWMKRRWGMEYGTLMEVKVRFVNRSHTFDKVRKDTAHRSTKLTISADGESLLMQDTVEGLNEFADWILGFGSAAMVLQPPELREAVVGRVKKALKFYDKDRMG